MSDRKRFRIIGGPIPKDLAIVVEAHPSQPIHTLFPLANAELHQQLQLRGRADLFHTNEGRPVIHADAFDFVRLHLVGGGQAKVVGVAHVEDLIADIPGGLSNGQMLLMLRAASVAPLGVASQQRSGGGRSIRLTAPLVVPKKASPPTPPAPPPKPDLALRVVGGPIPKDVRIVICVFHTTTFMDMFPMIHEKVEVVSHLAVVSARYYNLYEFELVRHGKGKKRRILFAKDTPASVGLISNLLYLEEKPVWQQVAVAAPKNEEEDRLSDIRPPSPTSSLRDRDVDTPPTTVVADAQLDDALEGENDGPSANGWWEAGEGPPPSASVTPRGGMAVADASRRVSVLKMQSIALKESTAIKGGKEQMNAVQKNGIDVALQDTISAHKQHHQLVRVIGPPIPRTARLIIQIVRTQSFLSCFAAIQSSLAEMLPTAFTVTPYRYELQELVLLPKGKTMVKQTLKLHDTFWTADFGLASVLVLREISTASAPHNQTNNDVRELQQIGEHFVAPVTSTSPTVPQEEGAREEGEGLLLDVDFGRSLLPSQRSTRTTVAPPRRSTDAAQQPSSSARMVDAEIINETSFRSNLMEEDVDPDAIVGGAETSPPTPSALPTTAIATMDIPTEGLLDTTGPEDDDEDWVHNDAPTQLDPLSSSSHALQTTNSGVEGMEPVVTGDPSSSIPPEAGAEGDVVQLHASFTNHQSNEENVTTTATVKETTSSLTVPSDGIERVDVVDIGASDSDSETDGTNHSPPPAARPSSSGSSPPKNAHQTSQMMSPLRRSSRYLLYEPDDTTTTTRPAEGTTRSIEVGGESDGMASSSPLAVGRLPPLPLEPCPMPTPVRERSHSLGGAAAASAHHLLPNVVDIDEDDDEEDIDVDRIHPPQDDQSLAAHPTTRMDQGEEHHPLAMSQQHQQQLTSTKPVHAASRMAASMVLKPLAAAMRMQRAVSISASRSKYLEQIAGEKNRWDSDDD